ncbi:MAG: hypothetical protein RLZZ385_2389 [Pseudomonadota bacterium]|jgi:D-alanyl-D-alanine dipeptidase
MSSLSHHSLSLVCLAILVSACSLPASQARLQPLVNVSDLEPSIQLDIRYITTNNFLGRPVDGYEAGHCLLTAPAATALQEAQRSALARGYSLKVYDCYRPQRAVDHFVRWAQDPADQLMKGAFYPAVPKERLFELGYIAARSGHSRGSTVDLTLVPLGRDLPVASEPASTFDCRAGIAGRYPDNSLDMGTGYDCFDVLSHTDHTDITGDARRNRDLLRDIMSAAGFVNYDQEWWHYTLADEPYADTYFDSPT